MNTLQKMSHQHIALASVLVLIPAGDACTGSFTDGSFTLTPEMRMDSGDYGENDTITTYEFSVTAEYEMTPDLTLSLRIVPYLYQDETYSDVVLVRGKPIHHADPLGTNPHSDSTHHNSGSGIVRHDSGSHHEIQQPTHHSDHPAEHRTEQHVERNSVQQPAHHQDRHQDRRNSRDRQKNQPIQTSAALQPQPVPIVERAATRQTISPARQISNTRQVSYEMMEKEVLRHGSASGIGDTYLDASYRVVKETKALPETVIHAGVTIPTADEDKGLGTGEMDYRTGFVISKETGNLRIEGGIDYNIMGDPDDYELDNYVSGYAGVTTSISEKLDMYMELSGAEAVSEEDEAELAATVQFSYDLEQYGSINAGISKGLSDGSPDFALLVGYSFSF